MEEGVVRLHFYPLPDTRYQTGVPGHYPPVVSPKHEVNVVEGHLMSARLEPPMPQMVPEEHADAHIIVVEHPNRRHLERSIMSPKVCKGLIWFQMVAASLICLVWCFTQLK